MVTSLQRGSDVMLCTFVVWFITMFMCIWSRAAKSRLQPTDPEFVFVACASFLFAVSWVAYMFGGLK